MIVRNLQKIIVRTQMCILLTLTVITTGGALYRLLYSLELSWPTSTIPFNSQEFTDLTHHQQTYDHLLLKDQSYHDQLYSRWVEIRDGKRYVRRTQGICEGNFSYNDTLGNTLAVDRDRWDTRNTGCAEEKRLIDTSMLLEVDVVIPFHNEQLSTLMRTIYSILNRTPEHILHSIILVDDFSDRDKLCLQEELETALVTLKKVKLVRTVKREGSTKARLIGKIYYDMEFY